MRRRARASTIIGGDTKVVEHGLRRRHVRHNLRLWRGRRARAVSVRIAFAKATACCSRDRSAITASRFCSRAASSISRRISQSDTRSLAPFVDALLASAGEGLHWMRDPTRGGVATALNELVHATELGITLFEEAIPLRDEVRGACEILGLDPLHIANEGQLLAVVAPDAADAALAAMRAVPGGERAVCIGEVRAKPARAVLAVNELRRQPHHRHAGRRSTPAHMLDANICRQAELGELDCAALCRARRRCRRLLPRKRRGRWRTPAAQCSSASIAAADC